MTKMLSLNETQSMFEQLKFYAEHLRPTERKFLEYLKIQFLITPASTQYHGCYAGGLLEHTHNVIMLSLKIAESLSDLGAFMLTDELKASIIRVALYHDLGKMGNDTEPYYKLGTDGKYTSNKSCNYDHSLQSLFWVLKYKIALTMDEIEAIKYHNLAYDKGHNWNDSGKVLLHVLHVADNLSAKLLESRGN